MAAQARWALLALGYGSIGICPATLVPFEPLGQYHVVIFYRGSRWPGGDLPGAWLRVQAFYPSRPRVSRRDWDEAQLTDITDRPASPSSGSYPGCWPTSGIPPGLGLTPEAPAAARSARSRG